MLYVLPMISYALVHCHWNWNLSYCLQLMWRHLLLNCHHQYPQKPNSDSSQTSDCHLLQVPTASWVHQWLLMQHSLQHNWDLEPISAIENRDIAPTLPKNFGRNIALCHKFDNEVKIKQKSLQLLWIGTWMVEIWNMKFVGHLVVEYSLQSRY